MLDPVLDGVIPFPPIPAPVPFPLPFPFAVTVNAPDVAFCIFNVVPVGTCIAAYLYTSSTASVVKFL